MATRRLVCLCRRVPHQRNACFSSTMQSAGQQSLAATAAKKLLQIGVAMPLCSAPNNCGCWPQLCLSWGMRKYFVLHHMHLLQVEEAKKQRDGQPWPAEDREALREKIRQRSGTLLHCTSSCLKPHTTLMGMWHFTLIIAALLKHQA